MVEESPPCLQLLQVFEEGGMTRMPGSQVWQAADDGLEKVDG